MKYFDFLFVSAALFFAVAQANASTLTLIDSQALGQVAPAPPGTSVETADFEVNFGNGAGNTFQSVFSGAQVFFTSTGNALPPGRVGTTVGGQLLSAFRNDGAESITFPYGAIGWTADASFTRIFNEPDPITLITSAGTNANAVMTLQLPGQSLSANARVDVTERIDGPIQYLPSSSSDGVDLRFFGPSPGNLSAIFASPEFTLDPRQTFQVRTSFFGNATSNGGTCQLCDVNVTAIVNGSNTGQLSFTLPEGVTLNPLENGETLSWVTTTQQPAPIPLPAGMPLLLASLGALLALTKVKRHP